VGLNDVYKNIQTIVQLIPQMKSQVGSDEEDLNLLQIKLNMELGDFQALQKMQKMSASAASAIAVLVRNHTGSVIQFCKQFCISNLDNQFG